MILFTQKKKQILTDQKSSFCKAHVHSIAQILAWLFHLSTAHKTFSLLGPANVSYVIKTIPQETSLQIHF